MKANLGESSGKKLELPFDTLTKHLIALGSSGSGKTVLLKALVEEAAINHIPSIVIDLQGDLSSLAIKNADKLVKTKIAIFTPASSKGIPICLNPLKIPEKNLDEEDKVSILNQISNNITLLAGYKLEEDKGREAQVALYKILENAYETKTKIETLTSLANEIETKAEELNLYELASKVSISQLIRKIKYLTIGGKDLLFSLGFPLNFDEFFKEDKISIIYMNTLSQTDKEFFLATFCTQLYEWMLSNPSKALQGLFVLDEISGFIPAGSRIPVTKPILEKIFKQARKYGIGCVVATQNPGDIDYKAFAQFGTWALGRLTLQQDRKKVKQALESLSKDVTEVVEKLPSLKAGEFLLFSPDNFDKIIDLKVRWLYTEHKTLSEKDLSEVLDDDVRKYYENKFVSNKGKSSGSHSDSNKGENREDPNAPLHLPLNIHGDLLTKCINKNTKKGLFKAKETLSSCDLFLEPLYDSKVKSIKKGFFKNSFEENDCLFNAVTGNMVLVTKRFTEISGIDHLLGLSEMEVKGTRLILESKGMTTAEVALKLKLQRADHITTSLSKSKLITKSENSWHSIVHCKLPKLNSLRSKFEISRKTVDGRIMKEKVKVEDISKVLRAWYDGAEIISHKVLYHPAYHIKYSGKDGIREIRLSGFSGELV